MNIKGQCDMGFIKNIRKNTILVLIITILSLYIILRKDWRDIILSFQNIQVFYIALAFLFFFFSIIVRGYINYKITGDREKLSIREAIKHNIIVQFFNGITPFSTGGQPMEIYMLTEHDIPLPLATNQVIQSAIFYQIALVLFGVFAILLNLLFGFFPQDTATNYFVALGFLMNLGVAVVLFFLSSSKRITIKIGNIFKWIVHQLKIQVEDQEIDKILEDYYQSFQKMKKNRKLVVEGIFFNLLSLACLYSVPYFVVLAMSSNSLSFFETLISSAYVYVMASFIPIPGSSGGIEYAFSKVYYHFVSADVLSAALILWRFITYYFGIILGAMVFNLEKRGKK